MKDNKEIENNKNENNNQQINRPNTMYTDLVLDNLDQLDRYNNVLDYFKLYDKSY